MAQLNITLDQDEILRLLADNSGDAFKILLQEALNSVLRAESAEQLRAAPYERTGERTDCRNGTRERGLTTRIGTIELSVPRHRNAPFKTLVFENYKRSEAALITTMAEMVVAGVSTAKVGRVMQEICERPFSKQSVSEACAELDGAVEAFRLRPIGPGCLFAMVDATYVKVRENRRIVSKALMIAVALNESGRKEVVGFELADREEAATWRAFLSSLRKRGLTDVRMFTSDAHEGIIAALEDVFPDAPWQRCQAHFARNISDAAPKRLRAARRGLRRRDDRDGAPRGHAQVHAHVELPREAEQGGQEALEGDRHISERGLGGQAHGGVPHGGERQVGGDGQDVLLAGLQGARGEEGGARRDSEEAAGPEEGGIAVGQ